MNSRNDACPLYLSNEKAGPTVQSPNLRTHPKTPSLGSCFHMTGEENEKNDNDVSTHCTTVSGNGGPNGGDGVSILYTVNTGSHTHLRS